MFKIFLYLNKKASMKKLIYLFFALLIFSCSSEEDEPVCLVCTNMDFEMEFLPAEPLGGTVSCAIYEGEPQCEGQDLFNLCHPGGVIAGPLNKESLNKIKRWWEENGAICTLK
jgi:hypothetical protein